MSARGGRRIWAHGRSFTRPGRFYVMWRYKQAGAAVSRADNLIVLGWRISARELEKRVMSRTSRMLCVFYALVALGALVATLEPEISRISRRGGRFPMEYLQDPHGERRRARVVSRVDLGFLLRPGRNRADGEPRRGGWG